MATITVKGARNLRPGDTFPEYDDAMVTEVWHDPEGTWVHFDDGDCGYMSDTRIYRVER